VFDPLDFLAALEPQLRRRRRRRAPRKFASGGPPLIKQVYEVDSLFCPKCGVEMKIISFIERRQSEVIEKILRHCGCGTKRRCVRRLRELWLWACVLRLFGIAHLLVRLNHFVIAV
jgi:hypothetical protein